jgi:hypothetical protein
MTMPDGKVALQARQPSLEAEPARQLELEDHATPNWEAC